MLNQSGSLSGTRSESLIGSLWEFYQNRTAYLTGALTTLAYQSAQGFAGFSTRILHLLGLATAKQIVVVTNVSLAREIAMSHEACGPHSRDHLKKFNTLLRVPQSILSMTDNPAARARSNVSKILHEKLSHLKKDILSSFQEPNLPSNHLYKTICKTMTCLIAKHLFGFTALPEDTSGAFSLNNLYALIEQLDKATMSMDTKEVKKAELALLPFSKWLYEHNKEAIENTDNLLIHIAPDINQDSNIGAFFLITINLSHFIALSCVHLSSDLALQERFRQVLLHLNTSPDAPGHFKRFYKEFARLYAGPAILSKYCPDQVSTLNGLTHNQFSAGTLFEFPVRRMRMGSEFGSNPMTFNEDRYLDENVANPLLAPYSPFGFGARACPASYSFIPEIFKVTMQSIFEHQRLCLTYGQVMEEIPVETHRVQLRSTYPVKTTRLHS